MDRLNDREMNIIWMPGTVSFNHIRKQQFSRLITPRRALRGKADCGNGSRDNLVGRQGVAMRWATTDAPAGQVGRKLATVIGMPEDLQQLRNQLVDGLRESGHVTSERVASAFRTVPRHSFVPGVEPERAYRDEALVIKSDANGVPISSSSQPAIMARMLEQLDVRPGHRVLEVGTGSGYNAALLAHLVGETGAVVSVDIDVDLVEDACARLTECGLSTVTVGCGDGSLGWAECAPTTASLPLSERRTYSPRGSPSLPPTAGWWCRWTCAARSARLPGSESVIIWKACRWSGAGSCVCAARWPARSLFARSVSNRRCLSGWPNPMTWMEMRFPRRWPSRVPRFPAAFAPRSMRFWMGSACGWRCASPRWPGCQRWARQQIAPSTWVCITQSGNRSAWVQPRSSAPIPLPHWYASTTNTPSNSGRYRWARTVTGSRSRGDHINDWNSCARPGTAGLRVSAYPYGTDPAAIAESRNTIDKRYNRLVLTWAA